jgi:hypothetical protein
MVMTRTRLQQIAFDCGITRKGLSLLKRIDEALTPIFLDSKVPWDLCNFIDRYTRSAAAEQEARLRKAERKTHMKSL